MNIKSLTRALSLTGLLLFAGHAHSAQVLLLQEQGSGDYMAIMTMLNSWGVEFDESATIPSLTVLQDYTTIIVGNQWRQEIADEITAKRGRLTNWLKGGGRTLLHLNPGPTVVLPRNVTSTQAACSDYNRVRLPANPLVAGIPRRIEALPREVPMTCANLTRLGKIVVVDQAQGPTLIDYCVGSGRVITTTIGVEQNFSQPWGNATELLPNMLNAAVYGGGCQNVPTLSATD